MPPRVPIVNMAFGPNNTFILWIDGDADRDRVPKYRSSRSLPDDLLGRLYGRHHDIAKLNSVALGSDQYYVVTMKLVTGRYDAEWDLLPSYRRLHRILKDTHDRGHAVIAIGPESGFYESSDGHLHCPSPDSGLTDEVDGMSFSEVKFVTLGLGRCGIILDKHNEIVPHGPLTAKYPTLEKDLKKYVNPESGRKVVSVALNAFKEDEYFVAFDDGTFCYRSEALGGCCSPPNPARDPFRYQRQRVPGNLDLVNAAEINARNVAILQGRKFDRLMIDWHVKPGLELEPLIVDVGVEPARDPANLDWLKPHASAGETPAPLDVSEGTNRGIAYGP